MTDCASSRSDRLRLARFRAQPAAGPVATDAPPLRGRDPGPG
jgi:hypothetical protein